MTQCCIDIKKEIQCNSIFLISSCVTAAILFVHHRDKFDCKSEYFVASHSVMGVLTLPYIPCWRLLARQGEGHGTVNSSSPFHSCLWYFEHLLISPNISPHVRNEHKWWQALSPVQCYLLKIAVSVHFVCVELLITKKMLVLCPPPPSLFWQVLVHTSILFQMTSPKHLQNVSSLLFPC